MSDYGRQYANNSSEQKKPRLTSKAHIPKE